VLNIGFLNWITLQYNIGRSVSSPLNIILHCLTSDLTAYDAFNPSSSFANGIGKSFLDRRAVHRPNRHPCTSQFLCICCTRTAKTRRGPSSYSNRYASQRDYKPLQCTPSRRDLPIWLCPFRFGVWVHLDFAQLQRLVGASLLPLNLSSDCGHNLLWSAIPRKQLHWFFVG